MPEKCTIAGEIGVEMKRVRCSNDAIRKIKTDPRMDDASLQYVMAYSTNYVQSYVVIQVWRTRFGEVVHPVGARHRSP